MDVWIINLLFRVMYYYNNRLKDYLNCAAECSCTAEMPCCKQSGEGGFDRDNISCPLPLRKLTQQNDRGFVALGGDSGQVGPGLATQKLGKSRARGPGFMLNIEWSRTRDGRKKRGAQLARMVVDNLGKVIWAESLGAQGARRCRCPE